MCVLEPQHQYFFENCTKHISRLEPFCCRYGSCKFNALLCIVTPTTTSTAVLLLWLLFFLSFISFLISPFCVENKLYMLQKHICTMYRQFTIYMYAALTDFAYSICILCRTFALNDCCYFGFSFQIFQFKLQETREKVKISEIGQKNFPVYCCWVKFNI